MIRRPPQMRSPGWHRGGSHNNNGRSEFTAARPEQASPEVLLSRLEGVQKSGNGWRARCPACGGQGRKLSIAEVEGRILLHCFACNDADSVLAAIGLRWADLHPPRHWPPNKDERESARRVIREAGMVSAVEVLAFEACVIEAAGRQLQGWQCLSVEDDERLSVAVQRVTDARAILSRPQTWRPAA